MKNMIKKESRESGFNFENTYAKLPNLFFSEQKPAIVPTPKLIKLNYSLINDLGLNSKALESEYGVNLLVGNVIEEDSKPIAKAYAGHQFGHFTMLGDGRAILLGEHITSKGERFDIELKGSGRTPYSRGGDGKAALGSMLREYIISEARYNLKIPTTRSLAVATTGEPVFREDTLQGAILTRVAKSHIRVGTFQYAATWGSKEDLKALADYTLHRHYDEFEKEENPYVFLLREVIKAQAELICKWQLVGFIHGVMNTDNMTISGETIDYGPCAFMDTYNSGTVFSSIDHFGRYAYGNQPNIGAWNLARFAETLIPLLDENKNEAIKIAQNEISNFSAIFKEKWISGMRAKLGFFNEANEDLYIIEGLLSMMEKYKVDYTNTFVALTLGEIETMELFGKEEFKVWYDLWERRLERQEQSREEVKNLMERSNPVVIPRNHRVEEALEAAEIDDFTVMEKLLDVLSRPYDYSRNVDYYKEPPKPSETPYRTYCGT